MKHILASILGLALSSCTPAIPVMIWEPEAESPSQSPPPSEVMNERAVTPRYGTGAIVVTSKERSWFTESCTYDVSLDDQLVAGLRPGQQVVLFADPGQRIISISVRDEASCDPASAQVAVEIVAHTTRKIRLGSSARYDLKVEVDSHGRSLPL